MTPTQRNGYVPRFKSDHEEKDMTLDPIHVAGRLRMTNLGRMDGIRNTIWGLNCGRSWTTREGTKDGCGYDSTVTSVTGSSSRIKADKMLGLSHHHRPMFKKAEWQLEEEVVEYFEVLNLVLKEEEMRDGVERSMNERMTGLQEFQ